jgi:hypothetical protein
MGSLSAGGIQVHPGNPDGGKPLLHQLGHLLGPRPLIAHEGLLALRANSGLGLPGLAMVADQRLELLVVNHPHAAIRAPEHMAAFPADNHRGKAPAIQEKDDLPPARTVLLDCGNQFLR